MPIKITALYEDYNRAFAQDDTREAPSSIQPFYFEMTILNAFSG